MQISVAPKHLPLDERSGKALFPVLPLTVFISARLCTAADGETELVQHAWVGVGCCGHPNGSCYCNHRDGSSGMGGCPQFPAPSLFGPRTDFKGKCCLWRHSEMPLALGHSPSSDQEERTPSR